MQSDNVNNVITHKYNAEKKFTSLLVFEFKLIFFSYDNLITWISKEISALRMILRVECYFYKALMQISIT